MNTEQFKGSTGQYPCSERTLGVYPQRQEELFMQRIKIFGGRIQWRQWRKIIDLARRYSKRSTIHITTRQDIELHDIAGEHLQVIQKEFTEVGLNAYGACGDCVRNITVCTGCTYSSSAGGIFPAAKLIYENLRDYPCDLPRKFKISFSGCALACGKPWISDLGFVLQRDGLFTVIGAGALGPRPVAGIILFSDIAPREILALCLATLEFFKEHGDRENRSKARLRHIRERLGDEEFKSRLTERFKGLRYSQQWPDVDIGVRQRNIKLLWRLQLPNGNIGLNEAVQLADAAESKKTDLRINTEHGLELFGSQTFTLPDNIELFKGINRHMGRSRRDTKTSA
jgi:sulfite reductase (ferredoxin)